MSNQRLSLRERQLEYLHILKELDRFCTGNGIRYYIGCGTLIGAVRHKGFIPWDDDLDVFIPQPDYDRLCQEYVSENYELVTYHNDRSHPYTFGRLYNKSIFQKYKRFISYGCGIDLYVIYGAPSSENEKSEHIAKVFRRQKTVKFIVKVRGWLVRHNLWFKKDLSSWLLFFSLKRVDREFRKYSFDDSASIWPFGGGRLILNKEWYGTPVMLEFEGQEFPAPHNYHEVLTAGYGDYMKLPPEEKRKPYHGGEVYYNQNN